MSGAEGGPGSASVLRVRVDNRLDEIDRVIEALEGFWSGKGLAADVQRRVKLAVDELLSNVIQYAYEDDDPHTIDLEIDLSANRVVLRISDDGHPFNPLLRGPPDVTQGIEERKIGGLGIHLLENLMDEVSYARQSDRNVITLSKHLSAGEVEPEGEKP